jgi:hypothetical protein
MGERTTADELVKKTVGAHAADLDFLDRYRAQAAKGPRPKLLALRSFAWGWDNFLVPLRYFTRKAAFEFSEEYLSVAGDQKTFERLFYGGGRPEKKRERGLKLSDSKSKPPIIRSWSASCVQMSRLAAQQHGWEFDLLYDLLAAFAKRRIAVC